METPIFEFLDLLLPVLVVFAARYVYQALEVITKFLNGPGVPALAKQVAVVVVAFALTKLGTVVGMPLPGTLEGLVPETISAILSALGAMGLHALAPKKV